MRTEIERPGLFSLHKNGDVFFRVGSGVVSRVWSGHCLAPGMSSFAAGYHPRRHRRVDTHPATHPASNGFSRGYLVGARRTFLLLGGLLQWAHVFFIACLSVSSCEGVHAPAEAAAYERSGVASSDGRSALGHLPSARSGTDDDFTGGAETVEDAETVDADDADFEAYARRHGLEAAYCPDDGGFPCEESRRREATYRENLARSRRLNDERAARDSFDGEARLGGLRRRAFFAPKVYADLTRNEFRGRFGNLKPLPDGERTRSKEKRKSWVELHRMFLERNKDLYGDRRLTDAGSVYAMDPGDIPKEWDWRDKGVVSDVWEQGACGGCWAFTTTAAMEGIHYIWTREKTKLSPQMLLECDPLDNDCAGGNMVTGFQYAVLKGGVAAEEDYRYNEYTRDTGAVGPCRENTARKHRVSIDDYIIIPNTWLDIKAAVLMQPVSVAVNGMSDAFRFYAGGILTLDQCPPDFDGEGLINHAVSAIGFGVDDGGREYLLIKNSWGPDWGEGGFAKIAMEGTESNATCGLLVEAVAPLKYSNVTYVDPKYDPNVDDYVDWVPKSVFPFGTRTASVIVTVMAVSFLVVTFVQCADFLGDDDDDDRVALFSDGQRDYYVYYGSNDTEALVVPVTSTSVYGGGSGTARSRREEQARREERAAGENLARGYAGHHSNSAVTEPVLGMPVAYQAEVSGGGIGSNPSPRGNL